MLGTQNSKSVTKFGEKKNCYNWVSGAIGRPAGSDEVKVVKAVLLAIKYIL